jgi:protease IV
MFPDADTIIDRRRLKRRLNFWRIVAVIAVVAGLIAAVGRFNGGGFTDYVARIEIDGLILTDKSINRALAKIAEADHARALIVFIDSPGGTVVGGEGLFRALRDVAQKKPVVAVMGNTATSAAYMAALGTDHIIAHAGTVTGSIGVILQTADVTGMLEKLGIKPETVKSGILKAQPNPMETFNPAAREVTVSVIADLHAMFLDMVKDRRGMTEERAASLGDGRIFSGRQALGAGLVDAIGRERDARVWLAESHGIAADLETRDIHEKEDGEFWRQMVSSTVGKVLFSERLKLDGVISLWHPGMK